MRHAAVRHTAITKIASQSHSPTLAFFIVYAP